MLDSSQASGVLAAHWPVVRKKDAAERTVCINHADSGTCDSRGVAFCLVKPPIFICHAVYCTLQGFETEMAVLREYRNPNLVRHFDGAANAKRREAFIVRSATREFF